MQDNSKKNDPFDFANLRLQQDFANQVGVKKVINIIPVRKPNKQEFIRVHPGESYQMQVHILELKNDGGIFLVTSDIAAELSDELVPVTLVTAINRKGDIFLWPIKLSKDGRSNGYNDSAMDAAFNYATKGWIRIVANITNGVYQVYQPSAVLPGPEWPDLDFQQIIRIAFKDRLITTVDHPAIKMLRGEI